MRYFLSILFLISYAYGQTDHLGSQHLSNTYDQILHIGNNDEFGNGLHIIERSDDDKTTVDSSAFVIGDSLAGTRATGMYLLQEGVAITASAADLNLLEGHSTHSFLYDSSGVFVNAPRTIYGWSHTMVFSATDYNTIEWTSGHFIYADGDSFAIDAGNTGNISAISWIYFDENVSATVLQTTSSGGAAVGDSRVVVCVADNNDDVAKDATYQVFGSEGSGVTIFADNIAANTITGNEILGNTLTISEINFSTVPGDSVIGVINVGGGNLFITADVINALSSSAAGQRIVIDPTLNQLKMYASDGDNGSIFYNAADFFDFSDGIRTAQFLSTSGYVEVDDIVDPSQGGYNRIYAKTSTTPQELWMHNNNVGVPAQWQFAFQADATVERDVRFTDLQIDGTLNDASGDAGTNGQLLSSTATGTNWIAASAGGNISNTGTPVDNQIAVWTDATTIEGVVGLTFDGTNLAVAAINTGEGNNELFDMNQNVLTTSTPSFAQITVDNLVMNANTISSSTGDIYLDPDGSDVQLGASNLVTSGNVDGVDVSALNTTVGGHTTAIGLNTTHRTSTGVDHSYIDQAVLTTSLPTFAQITVDNLVMNANTISSSTGDIYLDPDGSDVDFSASRIIDVLTIDTGHGANELYDMNQNVETGDAVTFLTLDTGFGANELYDMNQHVLTTSTPTFAQLTIDNIVINGNTISSSSGDIFLDSDDSDVDFSASRIINVLTIDTGQGPNELYDMDQNVETDDSPTFVDLELTGTALTIEESSAPPEHSSGHGKFWVDDATSAPPMYTTDDNQDLTIVTSISRTSLPGTTWEGRIVIDTDDNIAYIYADSGWRTIASGW